ncbi:peptide chain release factor N(5)-glutamine methyltransferase [Planktotalea sp.]|uniref:peptide chain release factor N(5)-glutamine methyltransferase n=1 Tax=Planktotalea sp. TaxID=2029877 RepID=UPI003D6A3264
MTLQELMRAARTRIAHVTTDDAMRELRVLAAHAIKVEPSRLTLHLHDAVNEDQRAHFDAMIEQRAQSMPVSKIVGHRLFWGRAFGVDTDVLDPRGDTETLIAACLELGAQDHVLDLGTGSGAIGLTLAAEWPGAQVTCTDYSTAALKTARQNCAALGLTERVSLVRSDWFENVTGQFDLIVSNPPYISLEEWRGLDPEVRDFDPRMALTDEADGLTAYKAITQGAGAHLNVGGHLMVEIGWMQGDAVQALFQQAGFSEVTCLQDLAGRDRVITGAHLK